MIIKLLIVFGVLIVVALTALAILRRRDDRKVDGIWRSLEATSTHQVFTEDVVSDLPAPARRYLLHAIRPGTALASSVSLEMRGTMRLKPEQEWMLMKARQILAPPKGFVWRAEVGDGLMRFCGGGRITGLFQCLLERCKGDRFLGLRRKHADAVFYVGDFYLVQFRCEV